jgi:hypothetical protein
MERGVDHLLAAMAGVCSPILAVGFSRQTGRVPWENRGC